MELTYENCDKLRLTRFGNLTDGKGHIYYYMDSCEKCNEPFLACRHGKNAIEERFCSKRCASKDKVFTLETRKLISESKVGEKNAMFGKYGKDNSNYRGGVRDSNYPLYDTYASQFPSNFLETWPVVVDGVKLMQVKCHYSSCRKKFVPKCSDVRNHLNSFKGTLPGIHNLYCSTECKMDCPIYGQKEYPKGFKDYKNNRPDQPQWRKMVLERDNFTCQKCGFHSPTGKGLVAHHMEPVIQNPIESMDIDIGITLCIPCDKEVHKLPGCSPAELRCKKPKKPKKT